MAQLTPPSLSDRADATFDVKPGDVLRALTVMASRSRRRQADVGAALRGAGLPPSGPAIDEALRLLVQQGAVSHVVPLSDGGVLLMVTGVAFDGPNDSPKRATYDLAASG